MQTPHRSRPDRLLGDGRSAGWWDEVDLDSAQSASEEKVGLDRLAVVASDQLAETAPIVAVVATRVWVGTAHSRGIGPGSDAAPGPLAGGAGRDVVDPAAMVEADPSDKWRAVGPVRGLDATRRTENLSDPLHAVTDSHAGETMSGQNHRARGARKGNRGQEDGTGEQASGETRSASQEDAAHGLQRVGVGALGETGQPSGGKPRAEAFTTG
jgi:hypothetical protein